MLGRRTTPAAATGACGMPRHHHAPHAPAGSAPLPAREGWTPKAARRWRQCQATQRRQPSPAPSGRARWWWSQHRRQPVAALTAAGRRVSAALVSSAGRQRHSRCLGPCQSRRMAAVAVALWWIHHQVAVARHRPLAARRLRQAPSPVQTASSSCRTAGPGRMPAPRSCTGSTRAACWGPAGHWRAPVQPPAQQHVAAGWQAAAAAAAPVQSSAAARSAAKMMPRARADTPMAIVGGRSID